MNGPRTLNRILNPRTLNREPTPESRTPGMTRIIGIGNQARGDDGVGLVAAARLRELLPDTVAVHQHSRDGASLILLWEPGDDVILIDAVMSGAAPGTLHERDLLASPLPAGMTAVTTHALGIREGVELARLMHRLPASLRFIGVEGRDFGLGQGLSAAVTSALEELVAAMAPAPTVFPFSFSR